MKKYLLIIISTFLLSNSYSQTIVLNENVNDTIIPTFGQNLKNYVHYYIVWEPYWDQFSNDSTEYKMGSSELFYLGMRYKRKLTNWYALGYDLSFGFSNLKIKQTDKKNFPDTVKHDKQAFNFTTVNLQLYQRFNFGRRGNQIGKYLDLGVYGMAKIGASYKTIDKLDNPVSGSKRIKMVGKNLQYIEPYGYGLKARIGIKRFAISGTYRLSDIIKSDYNYPEPPRLSVGLEIGFF